MAAAHGVTIYEAAYYHNDGEVRADGYAKPRQANTFEATLVDRANTIVAGPAFVVFDSGANTWSVTLSTGTLTGGETYVLEVSRTLSPLQGGHTFADYWKIYVPSDAVRRKPRRRLQPKRKPVRQKPRPAAQGGQTQ